MFYCGIDIAKYRHEATVIDQAGAAVQESISFANSKEGCEKLLALFQRLDISKEGLLIGMEATGHYWLSVYGYLLEQGFEVKVINPIQSEAFRKMYIRQTKNDRKDSFIIAQIMRFGQFSATNLAEEGIVAMRQLSRYRLALVDTCGDCKRRVIALLDQVFPEYDSLFSDTFGVTSKEVLSQYPTPEGMLTVSIRKLTTLLEKASHGRFGKEKAEQLKAAAASSFGVNFAKDAFASPGTPAAHRAAGVPGEAGCGVGGADLFSTEADRQLYHHHPRHWGHPGGYYFERNRRHPPL